MEFPEIILFLQASFIQISTTVYIITPNEYCVRSGFLSPCLSTWLHWGVVCFLFAVSGKCMTSTPQRWPFLTLTFDPWLFVGSQNPSGISLPNTFAAEIQTLQDIGQTPPTNLITFLLSSPRSVFSSSHYSHNASSFPVFLSVCFTAIFAFLSLSATCQWRVYAKSSI